MAHNGDSKIEKINLKIEQDFDNLLEELKRKCNVSKTELVRIFLINGVESAFAEDIEFDLSNLHSAITIIQKRKNKIPGIINRIELYKNGKVE